MTVVAGVDVGNTTTEIVIARVGAGDPEILAAGRAATTGLKGSATALDSAARLLERVEEADGVRAERIALCRQQPVVSFDLPLHHRVAVEGPLVSLASTATTPSDPGLGVGALARLGAVEPGAPATVALVGRDWDFEDAAGRIDELVAAGTEIAAVLVEADEARLIGNRTTSSLPIVDEIDGAALRDGETVAVEVAPPGATVRRLADPLWLAARFELVEGDLAAVEELTRRLAEARCAVVVGTDGSRPGVETGPEVRLRARVDGIGRALTLPADIALLGSVAPGSVTEFSVSGVEMPPGAGDLEAIRDAFAVALDDLRSGAWLREDRLHLDRQPLAVLAAEVPGEDLRLSAERAFARPALVLGSETEAARRGALTTAAAPPGSCVCDLGGGTIDLIDGERQLTAAGAGQLLTVALATLLGLPEIVAEAVKRGPCLQVETPHLARTETGEKRFLASPAGPEAIGRLCVEDGGRLRPFSDRLGAEEWRTIRLGFKRRLLAANIARCLRELSAPPPALLLAGGVAEDAEVAAVLSRHLGESPTVVATADVGGRFGPRHAAALGLVLLAAEEEAAPTSGR
ncbi:MAG: diol dehydratase reactivase [Actinobacteria bacterium]|nr:diol dehydratase reactivase [Actinomycetota bacterium]